MDGSAIVHHTASFCNNLPRHWSIKEIKEKVISLLMARRNDEYLDY
jgi:hypothetical protein